MSEPAAADAPPALRAPGEGTTVVVVATDRAAHERDLLPHAATLRSLGHRVVGMAHGLPGSAPAGEVYHALHDLPGAPGADGPGAFRAAVAIRSVLQSEQADLVWFHTPMASSVGRLAAATIPRHRRPLVAYMADGLPFDSVRTVSRGVLYRELERALSMVTDHMQVVNREDYELARRLLGRSASNTELTRGVGIDTELLARAADDRARVRAELGLDDEDQALLVVGSLLPEQRVADAIATAGRLGPPYRLLVVGTGPARGDLERAAAELPPGAVTFLGHRDDVETLLGGVDVLLHMPNRDGLPTMVLEAQAAGVPVVGARGRGTVDLLSGGGGMLCPMGDVVAFANAVRAVCEDDQVRAEVVRGGRERAAHHRLELATLAAFNVSLCLLGGRSSASRRSG